MTVPIGEKVVRYHTILGALPSWTLADALASDVELIVARLFSAEQLMVRQRQPHGPLAWTYILNGSEVIFEATVVEADYTPTSLASLRDVVREAIADRHKDVTP
mgnify:CR=1 FL=1